MTRRLVIAALAAAAMLLAAVPGHAGGTATRMYVATPGLSYSPLDTPVGLGGYQFETPSKLKTIDIDDLNGAGVRVIACQENDSNPPDDLPNVCGGEGDDVDIEFCSTGAPKNVAAQNFKPNSNISVFVITTGPATSNCPTVALGGSISWTW